MTPQALRHINESREQLLPKRELFGGEVMVLEKPSSQAITVKVDGKPVVFEIPKQASNDAFFSTFWNTLNKEKVIYSPSTGSFHSLRSLPYKQAEEFLKLSYSEAKERIPRHLQSQFTPEFFVECQGKSRTILAQKALK